MELKKRKKDFTGFVSLGIVRLRFFFLAFILILLLGNIFIEGIGVISLEFLVDSPRNNMTEGGIGPAIFGTVAVTLLMVLFAVPCEFSQPSISMNMRIDNVMELPRITKITLNMGVGETITDKKVIEKAVADMTRIAGQKPQITLARKSIATFKVREGYPVGCKVTLRRQRMWEFLDRLLNIALPRVRDFKGVSPKGFDGRGNYTLGLRDQLLFLEIDYMKVDKARGMNISVVTTARTDEESRKLLQLLGMPFRQA